MAPQTGVICISTLQKDWRPQLGLGHLLLTIRCLLIEPNAESALNEEAGKLLLEDQEGFRKRAAMFTRLHATAGSDENAQAKGSLHEMRKRLKRL